MLSILEGRRLKDCERAIEEIRKHLKELEEKMAPKRGRPRKTDGTETD